jgi:transposase
MLAIDVESGEEYLGLSSHAQSDDVARYMAHLTLQMDEFGVERLEIVLDQNTTHKQKMQQLYQEELRQLSLQQQRRIKTEVVFTYLPAYSPKLNVVEYAIHLLRQRCLHHRPYNMKIEQIEKLLTNELLKKQLLSSLQIINILQYMEDLVLCAMLTV